MELTPSANEWLAWLGRVRVLVITVLIGVVVAVGQWTPIAVPVRTIVLLAASWYVLAALDVMLGRLLPQARWHGPLQLVLDLAIITGVVYTSGAQDSYFISLYLLAILMGSILFTRRGAFVVAGFSFVLLAGVVELTYYGVIPRTTPSLPAARTLESWLGVNLLAFFTIAYLGSLLAQMVRKKGAELERKNEALRDLQAFNRDIIQSMRGGLLTTDMEGRILLLNRSGAEMLGRGVGSLRGESVAGLFPGFWPVEMDDAGRPLALRKEIEVSTPAGTTRFLGLSISPLRTGQDQATGYVFNFQDLTELRRLEREIVTKERMAALGRLSAAIAHEIRQPLTAMTGALKELARLAPLEEDDKKLVQIVSRESQRLNQIITEFLDYSRDKSYSFIDVDIVPLVEETLLVLERDAATLNRIRIERSFAPGAFRTRVDRDAMKQVFWNLCNNALRAMPDGGVLSIAVEGDAEWVRVAIRDTGTGLDPRVAARMFEPFQSGFVGGTGLGLAIVYQILQAHKGRIRAEAGLGRGSEFIVELPRVTAARSDSRQRSQSRAGNRPREFSLAGKA